MNNNNDEFFKDLETYYTELQTTFNKAKQGNRTDYIQLIYDIFKPTEYQKKNRAEIATPPTLKKDMLDKIPVDFWENKNNKILEPCCGKGGFLFDVLERLEVGLRDQFDSDDSCYKHIVEEMLYFADIEPVNIEICRLILDPLKKGYKLNFYTGDTLQLDINEVWGVKGFDLVVGNPPYQHFQQALGKRGGGDLIWNKFVITSLKSFINVHGFMCMVHPSGWRKPESVRSKYKGLFRMMTTDTHMVYLSIHGVKDGMTTFNCGTRYDWYVLQNIPCYKHTVVRNELGVVEKVDLRELEWLPNYNISTIRKLLAHESVEKCNVLYSTSNYESRRHYISRLQTSEFKYPCIHSTPKNGIRYMYSKVNDRGHFGIPKLIFGETGIYNAVIDETGEFGMTQHAMALIYHPSELGMIKQVIESDAFRDILKSCSWSNFMIDWRMFTYFKKDFWKEFM